MKKQKFKTLFVSILILTLMIGLAPGLSQEVDASGQMIVINPGHLDGVDPGAVNRTTGIREVDVNNALSIKVVKTLRDGGFNAMLSHPIPGNPGLPTLLKSIPNYNIYSTTICNTAAQEGADLLVSIHHNAGGPSTMGYEFYWSSYHPSVDNDGIYQKYGLWPGGVSADLDSTPPEIALRSRDLAHLFNKHFKSLDYVSSRNNIVERDDAITRKTSMPSVLIEAGFISNNAESLRLADGKNQQKMADKILISIREYFGDTGKTDTVMSAKKIEQKATDGKVKITISGISAPNGLKTLYVPTWTEKDGQDDVVWYQADKKSTDHYELVIDTKNHDGDEGTYHLHYYGEDRAGKLSLLATKTINFSTKMKLAEVLVKGEEESIKVVLKGVSAPNGLQTLYVPVWSAKDGQDDIKWYEAYKQSDGSYELVVDIKNHNNEKGQYNVHCYGVDDAGTFNLLSEKMIEIKDKMSVENIQVSSENRKISIKLSNLTIPNGLQTLYVPVWSAKNGQDDIKWYEASKKSDGSYELVVDTRDHNNDIGAYNIHCYGVDDAGVFNLLAEKTVDVTGTTIDQVEKTIEAKLLGKEIKVSIKGIPETISSVEVPTWSNNKGQDDIRWYQAESEGKGSFTLTINTDDHMGDYGPYSIHVYGEENGGRKFLGHTSIDMPRLIAISGNASVGANQLVSYYQASGRTFPQFYRDRGVDLNYFAQMYCEEAQLEGINVEVAFAQMLLETGYLQYGGQVKINQFNFAGLGAVDGGAGGFDFSKAYGDDQTGIRMGIRGHIQHLKCYANSEPLNQENVDPRWSNSLRGKAPYTYWLSIPNNPYQTGWASDPNYGLKLAEKIDGIRK